MLGEKLPRVVRLGRFVACNSSAEFCKHKSKYSKNKVVHESKEKLNSTQHDPQINPWSLSQVIPPARIYRVESKYISEI